MTAIGLLGVLLTVLKVMGYIHLGWGWVLLPFYGPFTIWLIIVVLIFLISLTVETHRPNRRRFRF